MSIKVVDIGNLKKEIIIGEIVNIKHCTMVEAEITFSQLEKLGLECNRKFKSFGSVYDLLEFAYLRRYISPGDEFIVKIKELSILNTHHKREMKILEKQFSEKYGKKEKWADETFEKYDEEKSKEMKKFADTLSKITADALKIISNQENVGKYLKYLDIFFGKN